MNSKTRILKTIGAVAGAVAIYAGTSAGSAQAATIEFESEFTAVFVPFQSLLFSDFEIAEAIGLITEAPELPVGSGEAMDDAADNGYEAIIHNRHDTDVNDPDTSLPRSWFLDVFLEGQLAFEVGGIPGGAPGAGTNFVNPDIVTIPFAFQENDIPLFNIVGPFATDDIAEFFDPNTGGLFGGGSFITNALLDCGAGPHDFGPGNCLYVPDPGLLNGDFLAGFDPGEISLLVGDIIGGLNAVPGAEGALTSELTNFPPIESISAVGLEFDFGFTLDDKTDIPAPATVLLFGAGLAALGAVTLRRRRCKARGHS